MRKVPEAVRPPPPPAPPIQARAPTADTWREVASEAVRPVPIPPVAPPIQARAPTAEIWRDVAREAVRPVPIPPAPPPVQARVPEPPPKPELVNQPREAPKPPPRLGPATIVDEVPAKTRRRSQLGLAILWMLGIGTGAVAAGAFVGFLVNGPPQDWRSWTMASAKPSPIPPPSPTAEIVEPKMATSPAPQTPAALPAAATATLAEPPAEPAPPPTQAARETPPAPAAPPPSAPNPGQLAAAEVMELQSRLRAVGFNAGPIDGSAGPLTVQAVRQYQQARRLAPTGTVDRELLAKLRQERPASGPPGSTQQAQAPPPPPPRSASPPGWTQQAQRPPPPPPAYAPPPRRENFMETIDRLLRR
jgi:peptidoglycan hydrolase-like protein with peptidoglycan-binding domain